MSSYVVDDADDDDDDDDDEEDDGNLAPSAISDGSLVSFEMALTVVLSAAELPFEVSTLGFGELVLLSDRKRSFNLALRRALWLLVVSLHWFTSLAPLTRACCCFWRW